VTYRDKVINAYLESLRAYGATEETITTALLAFDTGFSSGILFREDKESQQEMIDALSTKLTLN
jgi:hypothetical protein